MSGPVDRLNGLLSSLSASPSLPDAELLGNLSLGSVSLPVYTSADPQRLPKLRPQNQLDFSDQVVAEHLEWLGKKFLLGQDVFLYGPPSPFARRLALTFCGLTNRSYEIVTLHRDTGEAELKQGRELRHGGKLDYVDSPAVRAAKNGAILILEGVERAERGVLPTLNNLLENREMNLEDGTHIVSAERYALMVKKGEDTTSFIPAHKDFRIIAIGTPVPPFPGFPLDPPFRSRFQVRYLDPLASSKILAQKVNLPSENEREWVAKTADAISQVQITREMRNQMATGITSPDELPAFPQTALLKLAQFLAIFPAPHRSATSAAAQVAGLLLSIHPALSYVGPAVWKALEASFEGAGLGDVVAGISDVDPTDVAVDGEGILGWKLVSIERSSEITAKVSFERNGGIDKVEVQVSAGPRPFAPYPLRTTPDFLLTPRFEHQLCALIQLHALNDWDITILPPSSSLQSSSSSTTVLISTFARLFGYELETVHLVKDLGGGRELWMRRVVETGLGNKGLTGWEPSPLTKGAWDGKLVHFEGVDALGQTVGSLARLLNDREGELWEGKRMVGVLGEEDKESTLLSQAHPSFRLIATSSKSSPPREWMTEELSASMIALPTIAMPLQEEKAILLATGCLAHHVDTLETFARAYRRANGTPGSKSRRLGTASLLRMARRLAAFPEEGMFDLVNRTLLSAFLPTTDRSELERLLVETGIKSIPLYWNPPPELKEFTLLFPAASDPEEKSKDYKIPLFDMSLDPEGASHVPFMSNYLNNSQQTALMRDIAVDLEVLNEHVLLLGNQGVGKNKIIDRLLQLLNRPREFIQLHRDSTPQSLMFTTTLEDGVIRFVDSPLLRAVKHGRVIMVDETDKAAPHVVAGLASLAARGEMTLPDGRKIVPSPTGNTGDIAVHPRFRMILLANRPGYPFLGNAFLRVLGDSFSCYSVSNPDAASEETLLSELAPDLDRTLLKSLIGAFSDLRIAFEAGTLSYPFSLRELLALVRHMKMYPDDPLEQVLRNVFDFDISRPETLEALYNILWKNKLAVHRVGIEAARSGSDPTKKPVVIEFNPTGDTSLSKDPHYGKDDDKPHVGGNTWAGGTGGRSTAGLGGRGGYMRLYKGHDISQIPDSLKADVPEDVKNRAREMAKKELAARLAEIDLTNGQATAYSAIYDSVASHVNQLVSFLENLEANEKERIWLKRQSDGDLDESRLTEGLTGESTIYKRRGMEKPEQGKPQMKPKRLRIICDLSASMYRSQYDGRLTRSLEAAVMIMESFSRLTRKEKYRIDLVGQSGEEAVIPLVAVDGLPTDPGARYKVIQKMVAISQYTWAGDHTLDAIEKGVADVAETDADDYFVIAITDANFSRYGITADDLKKVMNTNPKVKCSLIAIGEGAEAEWLPKALPGKAFRVVNTQDIATTLRTILSQLLSGGL